MVGKKMGSDKHYELAKKYRVEDLKGAVTPWARLNTILHDVDHGKQIFTRNQDYLEESCLIALLQLIRNEISFNEFQDKAGTEQDERFKAAEIVAIDEERQRLARQKVMLAQHEENEKRRIVEIEKWQNSTAYNKRQLKEKYGLYDYIEEPDYSKIIKILSRVDKGGRLSEVDLAWLSTEPNKEYLTEELKEAYHKNEAVFFHNEFKKKNDSWDAVNASSHYRKCKKAKKADTLLSSVNAAGLKSAKLKSALWTTYGGVKRDLNQTDEALGLGKKAHEITPKDFRPCTLIGAVYMETGCFDEGRCWYEKAVQRGFKEEQVDSELRSIYRKADKKNKKDMREYLLDLDPVRYSWAK